MYLNSPIFDSKTDSHRIQTMNKAHQIRNLSIIEITNEMKILADFLFIGCSRSLIKIEIGAFFKKDNLYKEGQVVAKDSLPGLTLEPLKKKRKRKRKQIKYKSPSLLNSFVTSGNRT